MALMMRPMAWASRVTGFAPDAFSFPARNDHAVGTLLAARTGFMDEALEAFVAGGPGQVVVLGAGWDTRLYALQGCEGLVLFEVDAPATQAEKRSALERTGIDAAGVRFVACDFDAPPWPDALRAAGFDPELRTFLLWEGVSMYLDATTVAATLEVFATLPSGSRLAFDVFLEPWLEGTRAGRAARRAVRATYGEAFTWSMPADGGAETGARTLLEGRGLTLVRSRVVGPPDCPAYGIFEAARPADA
jgi:methyltransferase (TIGR00027 family)